MNEFNPESTLYLHSTNYYCHIYNTDPEIAEEYFRDGFCKNLSSHCCVDHDYDIINL